MINEIEKYAKDNNIPIMLKDGIEFLEEYIKKNNIKKILEIGSAIGYSAIKMALVSDDIRVTTIEKDKIRYEQAVYNISKLNLNTRIKIINEDALNINLTDEYDLIFIDAAKSQYINFFKMFSKNLKDNGVIISDNLNFHGYVNNVEQIKNRNLRQLVRKINEYINFLKNNEEFSTIFLNIGDGIGISKQKK
ncbi:MAG TPA: O-methyltransferase [Tenericutes bacterium]|nr:O-methyltransferase [Mycoplasmatota bacterium]